MLFNSIDFVLFLPLVFLLYWFVTNKNLTIQNLLVLIASYIFYGWWDFRFLGLILFSTVVDFTIGYYLDTINEKAKRKLLLWTSLIVNLGLLGVFKYYNFFIESAFEAFPFLQNNGHFSTLDIILPVGISFYTFQTLSYTIDAYHKKINATKDFIGFAAFVSFFPQLVAGPIERASNLLPQILKKRTFNKQRGFEGIRLILWGLFKKIIIADALAPSVNEIFNNYAQYPSHYLVFGAILFAFQIYGDFSGYSSIARGLAKLLGFELMINFNYPYFSRNIAEFWRKWHISLSTWFRDYLYIPLGGSRLGKGKSIRNIFIIFLVSGFWHGANWTFIIWGGIHAILFVPSFLLSRNRKHLEEIPLNQFFTPSLRDVLNIIKTFALVTTAWIFFRAESLFHALDYLKHMASFEFKPVTFLNPYDNQVLSHEIIYLIGFILIEYLLATKVLSIFSKKWINRILIDLCLTILLIFNSPISSDLSFIYFQF